VPHPGAVTKLAWRNLWRNYRRTVIILLAIVLGVWAMIFMNAMTRGMIDDMIRDGVRLLPGHAQIQHPDYHDDPSIANSMPPPGAALRNALSRPGVVGWSQRLRVPAVISSERESRGVMLIGADPAAEAALGFLPDTIVEGRGLSGSDDKGLVLGARLVEELETRLGKRVVAMSQDPDNDVADRGFRVVGIYRAELESEEAGFAYVGLATLQAMLGVDGRISQIAVLGDGYRDLSGWYPGLRAALDDSRKLRSWMELEPYLDSMLKMQDGTMLAIVLVIFAVLSFGLVNTIAMAVFERVREFGLMQALGMRPGLILYQVLLEAFLLLVLGVAAGNVLALATIRPMERGIDISRWAEGMEMMGAGATLYPALRTGDMILTSVLVVVLGLLASLLPAWRAARFDPVEALGKN